MAIMEVQLPKGKYMVAVSGGVDSVALLHLLHHKTPVSKDGSWKWVVAHYDHGIRKGSAEDRRFVEKLAEAYGLPFEYGEGKLGPNTSEATARAARYKFLRKVKDQYQATAIVTAHHQDDVLETAIINLLRGTGRKGLTALDSKGDIIRPLLKFSKQQIRDYALANHLEWREDSSNTDTKYLRNYVRHMLLPKLNTEQRQRLVSLLERQRSVNTQLDELLLAQVGKNLARAWFTNLPHAVAKEVLAAWLRHQGLREFDKPALERAVVGVKTARPGKRIAVKKDEYIEVKADNLALVHVER